MLQGASAVLGYAIEASDGRIGSVGDFLFDDADWTIRWLVLDLGTWLPGRKLLLHPESITGADRDARQLHVALTKAEVRGCPNILDDQPVSRQIAEHLAAAQARGLLAPGGASPVLPAIDDAPGDAHLRSLAAVKGYAIHADQGEVGFFADIVVDSATWLLRYLVVGTTLQAPGELVLLLLAPASVRDISWADRQIHIAASREGLLTGPAWVPAKAAEQDHQWPQGHYRQAAAPAE